LEGFVLFYYKINLQNTEKSANLPSHFDALMLKSLQRQGALPPTPRPGALILDPAGGFTPRFLL